MIVVIASIKGAPGVTTTAMALAAAWPADRRVLLVEADPFGGDLAAWFGVAPSIGLWSLLAAGRRGLDPHVVWEHATTLPTGLPVLYGLASADQAVANEGAWPAVAQAFAAFDADVVIDAGRLLPHFAGGIGPLLSVAQVLLVLCPPTLPGIVHLKTALPTLTGSSRALPLMVLPTAQKGFSSEEIAKTLNINVTQPLPHDPRGAAALSANAIGVPRSKTALAKWARTTAVELVASSPTTTERHVSLSTQEMQRQPLTPAGDDAVPVAGRLGGIGYRSDFPPPHDAEPSDAEASYDMEALGDARHLNDAMPAVTPTWVGK